MTDQFVFQYDTPEEIIIRLRDYQHQTLDIKNFKDYVRVELAKKNGDDGQDFNAKDLRVNGNVGIGTTTPAAKLAINGGVHVGGNSDPGDNNLLVDGNVEATTVQGGEAVIKLGIANYASFFHEDMVGNSNNYALAQYSTGITYINAPTNKHISFKINNTEMMRMTSTGNFGIGTTAPLAKLAINGGVHVGGTSDPGDNNLLVDGNIGIGVTTPIAKLEVKNGSLLFFGGTGVTPVSGEGDRMMWIPAKRALRAGHVESNQWDAENIGTYSIAMGYSTTANGAQSTAMGHSTTANGAQSTAIGHSSEATAKRSTAMGIGTLADRDNSLAIGAYNASIATNDTIFVIGKGTSATTKSNAFRVDKTGACYAASAYNSNGADYSEYFESADGKEISAGITVVLDQGGKIVPAKKDDTPIGIISKNPSVLGNSPAEWPGKYMRDDAGHIIEEEYEEEIMTPKKEKVIKERKKTKKKTVKEEVTKEKIVKLKNGKYVQKETIETVSKEIEESVFEDVDLYDSRGREVIGKHTVPVMESYEEEEEVKDEDGNMVMERTGKFKNESRL